MIAPKRLFRRLFNAGLVLAASVAQGSLLITNVTTVNVTPSGFSVVGAVAPVIGPEGVISISVYSDPGGKTNLAGLVGVESYPLNTGDPSLTNAYSRLTNQTALRLQTVNLGLLHIRVSDCAPATAYFYRLTASNTNGETVQWPSNSLATVTTAKENAFAVESDDLLVTLNDAHPAGSIVTFSNTNTATVLAAVVGDGALTNQAYFSVNDLINAGGHTNYSPLGSQTFVASLLGPAGRGFSQTYTFVFSTNFIVSQAGQFSVGQLTSSLVFGRDVERAGSSGRVPLSLDSSGALFSASFIVNVPPNVFASVSLQPASPLVASASVQVLSPTALLFSFQAVTGENLQGSDEIAEFNYTTFANLDSRFVWLMPQSLRGTNADLSPANMLGQPGRLVVIGPQPLLDTELGGPGRTLVLYGIPGNNYEIQSATDLRHPAHWNNLLSVPLNNLDAIIPVVDSSAQSIFYRAYQFTPGTPIIEASLEGLTAYGLAGANYALQYATNLSGTVAWHPLVNFTLTNSSQSFTNLGRTNPVVFYRLKRQ